MRKEFCDLCGEEISRPNGYKYKVKIKKYMCLWYDTWWQKLSICECCEEAIIERSKHIKEQKNENCWREERERGEIMYIEDKRVKTNSFDFFGKGEVFGYCDAIYIKTDNVTNDEGLRVNAVDLSTGLFTFFGCDAQVEKLPTFRGVIE